jgi:hypothetical protein
MFGRVNRSPMAQLRWLECENAGGSTVPAFGAVRVSGSGTDGVLEVERPTQDSQDVLINGPSPIPAGRVGTCTPDAPVYALYDGGEPPFDTQLGAVAGTYRLGPGRSGFAAIGGATSGRTMVRRLSAKPAPMPRCVISFPGVAHSHYGPPYLPEGRMRFNVLQTDDPATFPLGGYGPTYGPPGTFGPPPIIAENPFRILRGGIYLFSVTFGVAEIGDATFPTLPGPGAGVGLGNITFGYNLAGSTVVPPPGGSVARLLLFRFDLAATSQRNKQVVTAAWTAASRSEFEIVLTVLSDQAPFFAAASVGEGSVVRLSDYTGGPVLPAIGAGGSFGFGPGPVSF